MQDMETIISGCIQNDRKAQSALYKQFAPSMLGVCRRYTRTQEEAEDIMIDGFLQVFAHIGEFRKECPLVAWMKKIMVNAAISHFRINQKFLSQVELNEVELPANVQTNGEDIITKLEAKQVIGIMQEMPEEYRMILNLKLIENYSFKDIEKELGGNPNTLRVYFQRGKAWLMNKIQEQEKMM